MPKQETTKRTLSPEAYQELVREIGERVWRLWQQELRREQERATGRQRKRRR